MCGIILAVAFGVVFGAVIMYIQKIDGEWL